MDKSFTPRNRRRDSPFPIFNVSVNNLLVVEYQIHSMEIDREIINVLHKYGVNKIRFGYHKNLNIRDMVAFLPKFSPQKNEIHAILKLKNEIKELLFQYHNKTSQNASMIKKLINKIKNYIPPRMKKRYVPFIPKIKIMSQSAYYKSYGVNFR